MGDPWVYIFFVIAVVLLFALSRQGQATIESERKRWKMDPEHYESDMKIRVSYGDPPVGGHDVPAKKYFEDEAKMYGM